MCAVDTVTDITDGGRGTDADRDSTRPWRCLGTAVRQAGARGGQGATRARVAWMLAGLQPSLPHRTFALLILPAPRGGPRSLGPGLRLPRGCHTWVSTSSSRRHWSLTCSSISCAHTFSLELSCTSFRMASSTDTIASLLSMMNVARCWGWPGGHAGEAPPCAQTRVKGLHPGGLRCQGQPWEPGGGVWGEHPLPWGSEDT